MQLYREPSTLRKDLEVSILCQVSLPADCPQCSVDFRSVLRTWI